MLLLVALALLIPHGAKGSFVPLGGRPTTPNIFGRRRHQRGRPPAAPAPSPGSTHVPVISAAPVPLRAGSDDDGSGEGADPESSSAAVAPLAALAGCALLLAASLHALATNPALEFDVDLYVALDRALGFGFGGGGGGGGGGAGSLLPGDYGGEIVELPALSPAEQLVGALFGPPHR